MSVAFLKFKHPFTCLCAGSTSSGKTVWTRHLLENWKYLIDMNKKSVNVLWCFGQNQDLYRKPIKNVSIDYYQGIPSLEKIQDYHPDIIVIDDLMDDLKNDNNIRDLFTRGSHHMNISIIFIVQNIFNQDKNMRTISLNAHYINIMKGIRLTQQIGILGNQIYPGKSKQFIEVFKQATKNNFSYLLIDLHPRSPDQFRLRSRIFKHELPSHCKSNYDSVPIYYEIK